MLKALLALVAGVTLAGFHFGGPPGRVAGIITDHPPARAELAGIDGGGAPGIHDRKPSGLNDTVAEIHGRGPPA